jgi:hypothetical protein
MIKNDQQLKNLEEKLDKLSAEVLIVLMGALSYFKILYLTEITQYIGTIEAEIRFYKEMRKKWYWFILKHFLP